MRTLRLKAARTRASSSGALNGFVTALLLTGLDFITAFSAIIACINNMGPGLGEVGPSTNYASLTDLQSWICALAMILGRLELFPLLVLGTVAFWRK